MAEGGKNPRPIHTLYSRQKIYSLESIKAAGADYVKALVELSEAEK
jgi:hypothetical protein